MDGGDLNRACRCPPEFSIPRTPLRHAIRDVAVHQYLDIVIILLCRVDDVRMNNIIIWCHTALRQNSVLPLAISLPNKTRKPGKNKYNKIIKYNMHTRIGIFSYNNWSCGLLQRCSVEERPRENMKKCAHTYLLCSKCMCKA